MAKTDIKVLALDLDPVRLAEANAHRIPVYTDEAKKKINPMIGAAGISAFPMSARVVQKLGLAEDPTNHLLMHAIGANVSGQIASVVAGGLVINLVSRFL